MKNIFIDFFILILFSSSLFSGWKQDRERLDHVYIQNEFRIFYTLMGKDALPEDKRKDINENGIPDFVENISLQLSVADEIYSNILGFIKPLKNRRFHGSVEAIDVHILRLVKGKGSAGDGVISYKYKNGLVPNLNVLSITISNTISATNLTPAHELFHCYQNGYTMFKNRWYTEGTSRWVEYAFKQRTGKQHDLPSNKNQIKQLLNRTYGANTFWNRLLFLCASDDKGFLLPQDLQDSVYIGKDQRIVKDNTLFGYKFLKIFFELMDKYDDEVTNDRSLTKYDWQESEQKSFDNNPYIFKALKETVSVHQCENNAEVEHFIKALDDYLSIYDDVKDVSMDIETVGIPYLNRYKDSEDIYARNVWDMQFFNNSLYIAAGNSSNVPPAPNAGPVPIINYNIETERFLTEGTVVDEQIDLFKVLNETLYIPGHDTMKGDKFGNFYTKKKNTQWIMHSNIPSALHVFDMQYFNGRLFAAISTVNGAGVAISDNQGESWKITLLGPMQRTYTLMVIDDILYAIKQELSVKQKKKLSDIQQKNYFIVAEFRDGHFVPRYDLKTKNIFPKTNLKIQNRTHISRSVSLNGGIVYLTSYNDINPFALFVSSSFQMGYIDVEKIEIPSNCTPRDILVRENQLYILCSKETKNSTYISVLKSSMKNLVKPRKIFQFKAATFARSFEEKNGIFYFGLGCNVKNKKYWKQEELISETGQIIKVKIDEYQI